ncbi:anti-sigma factor family protein [Raoultella scottii]|uniref:anti-sigma factor family protein n=1 Tax=Raoultella scottii TaxID=3040937 RepID=UPI002FA29129
MKSLSFTPPYNDEAIVAWLDGEMSDADARRFEAAFKSDGQLAARTAELMSSNQNYRQAFAPLLDEAPLERMQARLEAQLAEDEDSRAPRPSFSRRSMIAASLSFLLIGSGLGYLARAPAGEPDESENIRDLEARYMSLYSAETLLDLDSSSPLLQRGLTRTAEDIGLHLNEQQLRLQGAELKMVRMLRYDSTSIAQIAWMHAEYGPMALCISPLRQPGSAEISSEQRHGMNLAWWHDRGYQFVLIGRNPGLQLHNSARALQAALS